MIKVAVSNWSFKKTVMKLLRFESHKIVFVAFFVKRAHFLTYKHRKAV